MMYQIKSLVNPNILDLRPQQPQKRINPILEQNKPERLVKLAANENPLPPPREVREVLTREIPSLNLYPEPDNYSLIKGIADYNGVSIENVVAGSGSAELIRKIVKVFLKPGEKVLTSRGTFPMYKVAAVEQGGNKAIVETSLDDEYGFDLKKMNQLTLSDDKIKIIFIANPNNPTGTVVSKTELNDFIERTPLDRIIVLDNAYQEYVDGFEGYPDGIDFALNRKNIVVLRTFSKIYALAGLRIGYGIANEELISYLSRAVGPYNLTKVAQQAALFSLESDDFKNRSVEMNSNSRKTMYGKLMSLDIRVIPSFGNFLLFFPEVDVSALNNRLVRKGVIIAALGGSGIPDGMRVTIGLEEDNIYFIEKLKEALTEIRS